MENKKTERLAKKAGQSMVIGVVSFIASVIAVVISSGYATAAEQERMNDPEYKAEQEKLRQEEQKMRALELETQRQKYALEQEKMKMNAENKRLSAIRENSVEALEKIDKIAEATGELDDYGYVDAAYRIAELFEDAELEDRVKYRAAATISGFIPYTTSSETDKKLEEIIGKIS